MLSCAAWIVVVLASSSSELAQYDGHIIAELSFEVTGTCRERALRRNFLLGVGDSFDSRQWEFDTQQLLNLGFFRTIETTAQLDEAGLLRLLVEVRESWSILPVFGYTGGSILIFIAGGLWANVAGEMVESGAFYMRRDDFNLVRAWLKLPNVLWYGSLLELQVVMNGILAASYPAGEPERPDWDMPTAGREAIRRGFLLDLGHKLIPGRLALSGRYLYLREQVFDIANYPEVVLRENSGVEPMGLEREPLAGGVLSLAQLQLSLGGVDMLDNYLYRGHEARLIAVASSSLLGSYRDFMWLYSSYRGFVVSSARFNLGWQLTAGTSTSADPIYQLAVGGDNLDPFVHNQSFPGLLTIRGFRGSHFTGRNIWFANLEARATLTQHLPLWLLGEAAVQAAVFSDAGWAWDGAYFGAGLREDMAVSIGAGLLGSLVDFRYTYLNWYVARALRPVSSTMWAVVLTRPFF